MLSRDCDGCSQLQLCKRRFRLAVVGEIICCPDGTGHLIDGGSA